MSDNRTGLTRYEQETVINYNNEEQYATIYSRDPNVLRKLAKMKEKYPDAYEVIEEDKLSKTYKCSKKLIRFGNPPKPLTEEEKAEAIRRLQPYIKRKEQ
ncbi:MAG: hypothetical protein VZS44_08265 [Bacilli bacterium]|nr:hypothetical protein [Bacilli bacterium]